MADIVTEKAIGFTHRAREVGTILEQAYWLSKRLVREWYAQSMSVSIPDTADPIVDRRDDKPLTGSDVTLLISSCEALISDWEANSNAVLNIVVKTSDLPVE